MWERFRRTVQTLPLPPKHRRLRPTLKDLNRFEREYEFKLPEPYRSFVLEIGPGEVGEYHHVLAPLYRQPGKGMQSRVKAMRSADMLFFYPNDERVLRMIPFASTAGGDSFVWDPAVRCHGKTLDYPVYVLPRDWDRIVQVAKNFKTFLYDVCLGRGLERALPYIMADEPFERTFRPLALRRVRKMRDAPKNRSGKKRPGKKA